MAKIEVIDTTATNICDHGFCGFRDPKHEGHKRKTDWLKKRFAEGLKFKVLQVDGEDAGMIEYIPGEHTWRPVDGGWPGLIRVPWAGLPEAGLPVFHGILRTLA